MPDKGPWAREFCTEQSALPLRGKSGLLVEREGFSAKVTFSFSAETENRSETGQRAEKLSSEAARPVFRKKVFLLRRLACAKPALGMGNRSSG